MDWSSLGKWMLVAGAVLAAAGGLLWLAGKWGLPLGALPGDIQVTGKRGVFYFPVVTCIVISIVLTILLNVIGRFFGK